MEAINVRQLKGHIKDDSRTVTLMRGDKKKTIGLAYQKTGFGQKRFFICPHCSKNVEQLYLFKGRWWCKSCSGANPYYGIQNSTKGGYDEIAYRMKRYAASKDIVFSFPFNYLNFVNDPRVKKEKFRTHLTVLQALENMRFHSLFFKESYKPSVLKLVITGKHRLLSVATLDDLKNNVYDWNKEQQLFNNGGHYTMPK